MSKTSHLVSVLLLSGGFLLWAGFLIGSISSSRIEIIIPAMLFSLCGSACVVGAVIVLISSIMNDE